MSEKKTSNNGTFLPKHFLMKPFKSGFFKDCSQLEQENMNNAARLSNSKTTCSKKLTINVLQNSGLAQCSAKLNTLAEVVLQRSVVWRTDLSYAI